eukprot:SAG22_NODE_286_length_12969_cov_6.982828_5_plen_1713_part_00
MRPRTKPEATKPATTKPRIQLAAAAAAAATRGGGSSSARGKSRSKVYEEKPAGAKESAEGGDPAKVEGAMSGRRKTIAAGSAFCCLLIIIIAVAASGGGPELDNTNTKPPKVPVVVANRLTLVLSIDYDALVANGTMDDFEMEFRDRISPILGLLPKQILFLDISPGSTVVTFAVQEVEDEGGGTISRALARWKQYVDRGARGVRLLQKSWEAVEQADYELAVKCSDSVAGGRCGAAIQAFDAPSGDYRDACSAADAEVEEGVLVSSGCSAACGALMAHNPAWRALPVAAGSCIDRGSHPCVLPPPENYSSVENAVVPGSCAGQHLVLASGARCAVSCLHGYRMVAGVDAFVCSAGQLFRPTLTCELDRCQCSNGLGTTGGDCPGHGMDRCKSCYQGYGLSYGRCELCAAGTFAPSWTTETLCRPCRGCSDRGQELDARCTATRETTCRCGIGYAGNGSVCTPCEYGRSFTLVPGQAECAPCTTCQEAEGGLLVAACTVTSNAICTCRPGCIGQYPNCVPDLLDCYLPPYIETTPLFGNRDAEVCPHGYRPISDPTVCERAAYALSLPDRTVDLVEGDVAGAPAGCLVFGDSSPVFAEQDTEQAQFCIGCTVACEHNNRLACQLDQCNRPLYVRTERAGGNFGADDCPLGYRIVSEFTACETAAAVLAGVDTNVDVTVDVDGAPQGCLLYGTKPVFAERDVENARWCIGCTVVCEYNNRAACELGLRSTATKTCGDSNGDGVDGDNYECGFGTLKSPIPDFKCAAAQCSFQECCVMLNVECAQPMYAAATRDGADWGADECPTNYKAITDPTACANAAITLGMDDITVDAHADIAGAPAGCLKFGYSDEYEHDLERSLIYTRTDLGEAGLGENSTISCNGCIALCEHSFRTVCETDENYNIATCSDADGDGELGDHYNCTAMHSDMVIKAPVPHLPCGGHCDRVDCCVSLGDVCNGAVFVQSTRDGGAWGADECPHGYRPITDPAVCERAAYALSLPDRTVDLVEGDVAGAPAGCLVFGDSSPVFAERDTEQAQFCIGCTVACEHNYRAECVTARGYVDYYGAWVPGTWSRPARCEDPNGDGATVDSHTCNRGVLASSREDLAAECAGNGHQIPGGFCSDADCCAEPVFDAACSTKIYRLSSLETDWGRDECPSGYVPIHDATVCQDAAVQLGLDDTTVDVLGEAAVGMPGGCIFKNPTSCSGAALQLAPADTVSPGTCKACTVVCQGCMHDAAATSCADSNGDGITDDPHRCGTGVLIQSPASHACGLAGCTDASCCETVAVSTDCDLPWFVESSRAGGNCAADECPSGYRIVGDAATCGIAAAALGAEDGTVDMTGDIDGAPAGCLMYGTSPVFAEQDDGNEGWCQGCTVLCELDGRVTCAAGSTVTCTAPVAHNCSRNGGVAKSPMPSSTCPGGSCTDIDCCDLSATLPGCQDAWYVQGTRDGGDWSADECPRGYEPIGDAESCRAAVENLTAAAPPPGNRTVTVDLITRGAGDAGAAVGCLLYGQTAIFASGDADAAVACAGCTAVCSVMNLTGCVAEAADALAGATNNSCSNIHGRPAGSNHTSFNCSSNSTTVLVAKESPRPRCTGGRCTETDCCDVFNAAGCADPWYVLGTREGGDWTADECPGGYARIDEAAACRAGIGNLTGAVNATTLALNEVGDVDLAPRGCLLFGGAQAVFAENDAEDAAQCRGCQAVCGRILPQGGCDR